MKRILVLALLLLLALFMLPGRALAHAHLVRADLAPNSHLRVSVGTVRFWFDEPLNPALSRILILNRQGQQVNVDTGELNAGNDEELDLTVPTLPDGLYSVRWTSASALDGHIMHGFYLFTVGGPGAVAPPSVPAAIAGSDGAALDAPGMVVALAHWLVLLATALWTGALALEVLVLAPARMRDLSGARSLAFIASQRAGRLVRLGLLATLLATVLELEAAAYAAAGDWSGPLSPGVLGDVLGTQYGAYFAVRGALVILTLLVASGTGAWGPLSLAGPGQPGLVRREVARRPTHAGRALDVLTGRVLAALGLAYLLALALSGHAGALPHLTLTAVGLDWLHLIAMAVWVGGMAAIALVLVPVGARGAELLDLLDRFSPAAYLALVAAAMTGMFNAQVRLAGLDALTGTLYGRVLLLKLALIAAIMALSASHVFVTRPRLRAALPGPVGHTSARAYGSLVARLRVEPALGALILLCVAVMGQVAPHAAAFDATVVQVVGDQGGAVSGGPVAASGSLGALAVNLQINPADVGQTQLTATVAEHGRAVTDGQVRVRLSMPANPDLGASFVETTPAAGSYSGTGDLVQEGLWRADVLVRTHSDPSEFRDVPFVFLASTEPALLSAPATDTHYGPATLRLSSAPGAAATLAVRLRPGLRVRSLITMPDMSPQENDVQAEAGGWYRGAIVPPMEGYMNLAVQVWEGGAWHTVRMAVCQVDSAYALHLLL
jgi:copper transport protein